MRVRGYLSTAFGCPYEGNVAPDHVATVARRLADLGVFEVAISDTIGVAHPGQVPRVLDAVLARVPVHQIALHFHDTRSTAMANLLAALRAGATEFDASVGGLGGSPFAPGAGGNVATEDLVISMKDLGVETGVHLDRLLDAARLVESLVGHPLASAASKAGSSARRAREGG